MIPHSSRPAETVQHKPLQQQQQQKQPWSVIHTGDATECNGVGTFDRLASMIPGSPRPAGVIHGDISRDNLQRFEAPPAKRSAPASTAVCSHGFRSEERVGSIGRTAYAAGVDASEFSGDLSLLIPSLSWPAQPVHGDSRSRDLRLDEPPPAKRSTPRSTAVGSNASQSSATFGSIGRTNVVLGGGGSGRLGDLAALIPGLSRPAGVVHGGSSSGSGLPCFEPPPAKRSSPPSMGANCVVRGGGVESISKTGSASSGGASPPCFNTLASLIPGSLRPAQAVCGDSSICDLQLSAPGTLAASLGTAGHDDDQDKRSGSRMGHDGRMAPSTSPTKHVFTRTGEQARQDVVAVAAPFLGSTGSAAACAIVNSNVLQPRAAGTEDTCSAPRNRNGVGVVPSSPRPYPAASTAWSPTSMSGASTSSARGGLQRIAPSFSSAPRLPDTVYGESRPLSGINLGNTASGEAQDGLPDIRQLWSRYIVIGDRTYDFGECPLGVDYGGGVTEHEEVEEEETEVSSREAEKVPPGTDLNITPWCCANGRAVLGKRGEPGRVCIGDPLRSEIKCKRWMCHACLRDESRGNGCATFRCCDCELVLGPCWCHK